MEENPNKGEAERLLGIADKLLQQRDLNGSKEFAILAQENEPLLEGSDQILAICDVLIAAEQRINNHRDWYSILQVDRRSDEPDSIKKQYRRLALLLHPDKNKYAFADHAFKLVADAWAVLSDASKKSLYDKELSLFNRIDLPSSAATKLPVRRTGNERPNSRLSTFWTVCPYCYVLFEYPKVYENCCLRCQKCRRAFHAVWVQSLPPMVPGKEAYYCCWGFFPLGFASSDGDGGKKAAAEAVSRFPNWMPPIFEEGQQQQPQQEQQQPRAEVRKNGVAPAAKSPGAPGTAPRKRGRPRKNPL